MKICLVGATHPCHNPRLVREADLLSELGHDVRVVAPCYMPELAERNRLLLSKRTWRLDEVDFQPLDAQRRLRSIWIRGRKRLAERASALLSARRLVEIGLSLALPELTRLASRERADWYIAHTQLALPAAARAAKRWHAKLGFDCEDLLAEAGTDDATAIRQVEQQYLGRCRYVSVPSRAIAVELAADYGIGSPIVLYNVFPLSLAEGIPAPQSRERDGRLRLHWFSQTIGYGRGLEEAVEAVAMLPPEVELHLRGCIASTYRDTLERLVRRHGLESRVFVHDPLPHDELIRAMADYDVGLCLERATNGNYGRTVTNKLFSYMLAGLAIAASDTPGQREALASCPSAGFLYASEDADALASGLRAFLDDPIALARARLSAWEAAQKRFCWDVEAIGFLEALGLRPATAPATVATAR